MIIQPQFIAPAQSSGGGYTNPYGAEWLYLASEGSVNLVSGGPEFTQMGTINYSTIDGMIAASPDNYTTSATENGILVSSENMSSKGLSGYTIIVDFYGVYGQNYFGSVIASTNQTNGLSQNFSIGIDGGKIYSIIPSSTVRVSGYLSGGDTRFIVAMSISFSGERLYREKQDGITAYEQNVTAAQPAFYDAVADNTIMYYKRNPGQYRTIKPHSVFMAAFLPYFAGDLIDDLIADPYILL